MLPPDAAADADALGRFRIEARAAARLVHPNAVNLYDFDCVGSVYYVAMEKVTGGSLDSKIKKCGPLNWEAATKIVLDMARVLAEAHRVGLIHRDIKPANILLTEDGTAKLSDFGLAKLAAETSVASGQLTHTGAVLGTPAYLSPEQAQATPLDGRSDLYSLGMTWYAMLTGRPPFSQPSMTPTQLMFAHVTRPTPDPRQSVPGIPEPIVAVLFRMTAKSPTDRYANADALAKAVEEAIELAGVDSADRLRNAVAAAASSRSSTDIPTSATGPGTVVLSTQVGGATLSGTATPRRTLNATRSGRSTIAGLPNWVLPLGVVVGVGLGGGAVALWQPWANNVTKPASNPPSRIVKQDLDRDSRTAPDPTDEKSKPHAEPAMAPPTDRVDPRARAEQTELTNMVERLLVRKIHTTLESVLEDVVRFELQHRDSPLAAEARKLAQRCRLNPVETYRSEPLGSLAAGAVSQSRDGALVAVQCPKLVRV